MKSKRFAIILTAAVTSLGLFVIGAAPEANRDVSADEVKELKSLVSALEKKIDALQTRLQAVEKRTRVVVVNPKLPIWIPGPAIPSVPVIVPKATVSQPQIWGRGECNGWSYYLIPLNHENGSNR